MDSFQIILTAGLVALGFVSVASLLWAFSLDNKLRAKPAPPPHKVYEVHIEGTKVFSDLDMHAIEGHARAQIAHVAQDAADRLRQSLNNTTDQVAARVNDTIENSISQEFEKYQVSLEALREQSIEEFSKLQRELDERRIQLTEQLDKKIAEEFTKRMDQFDARLDDVVSSYLAEALGNQVDLGAQTAYIVKALEEHKDEIKKDVLA